MSEFNIRTRGMVVALLVLFGLSMLPASASAGLSPSQINFPLTSPGSTSAARVVTLSNTSGAPLTVSFSVNGHPAFLVENHDCPAQLAPGASCQLLVSFKPTTVGVAYTELTVPGNGYTSLVGQTPTPEGTITPGDAQDFGLAVPGAPKTRHFTIESTGAIPLPIAEVTPSGMNSEDFSIVQSNACIGELEPGDTCEFDVRFDPVPGWHREREALLVALDPDDNALLLVELSGSTTVAEHTVTPDFKDFGEAAIGTGITRQPATFTITSTGDAPLPYSGSEIIGGNDTGSYSIEDSCPSSLPPGESCSVRVRFDPTSGVAGPRPAAITLKAGISESAYSTILMTGTAVDAPVVPPPGKADLTLRLKSAKKVRRGGTLVLSTTVTNTGDAPAASVRLGVKAPNRLVRKVRPVRISGLAAGRSVTRKIRVKVKRSARKGRKLALKVSASGSGFSAQTARRTVRIL
ncbi:MAG TPA: choice-of-anchor D domain-containing protein [Solirubrobacterales bacterium]|nr:choice-of-anchor D domain-containing protein [Solirubrobacterales bacterium]